MCNTIGSHPSPLLGPQCYVSYIPHYVYRRFKTVQLFQSVVGNGAKRGATLKTK